MKRPRQIRACAECRKRRIRCNQASPCEACISARRTERCTAIDIDHKAGSKVSSASPYKPDSNSAHTLGTRPSTRKGNTYPSHVLPALKHAAHLLPVPDRAENLIRFYLENLDWYLETGEYDDMILWLPAFLRLVKHSMFSAGEALQGDATRLALVLSIIHAALQALSEDALRIYFLDPNHPPRAKSDFKRITTLASYERALRWMLDTSLQNDGYSEGLLRALIFFYTALKNEGTAEEEVMKQIGKMVVHIALTLRLHREPDSHLPIRQQESLRRLFKTVVMVDSMCCVDYGYPSALREQEITCADPKPQSLSSLVGLRDHSVMICLARLSSLQIQNPQQEIIDDAYVLAFEKKYTAVTSSFPAHHQPCSSATLPSLTDRNVRFVELQQIFLQGAYHNVRSTLHRRCFFPTPSISYRQMQRSRGICIDAALSMISLEEAMRMRAVADFHLRSFHFPYYTLEAAMTLILALLVELSEGKGGGSKAQTLASISRFINGARRASVLLQSLPSDFITAFQGAQLVTQILERAERVVDLYKTDQASTAAIRSAVNNLLYNEKGERVTIPYLERSPSQPYRAAQSNQPEKFALTSDLSPPPSHFPQQDVLAHEQQTGTSHQSHSHNRNGLSLNGYLPDVLAASDARYSLFPNSLRDQHAAAVVSLEDEAMENIISQLDFWLDSYGP